MSALRPVELSWLNKERVLVPLGSDDYEWIAPEDSRAREIPSVTQVGSLGGPTEPSGNVFICGDAYDALRWLDDPSTAPGHYRESIRLVYIDPPFNRKQSFSHYEDSLEHSMWLSMLRDRLIALLPLLAPSASMWLHLDDAEVHRARCVLDEVFGEGAFVSTVVWQKRTTRESRSAFSSNHDYIHVYAPAGPQTWKASRNLLERDPSSFRNRDDDPRGPWTDAPFTAPGFRANQHYPIVNPAGETLLPPKGRSWYATQPVYENLLADNRIWFPRAGEGLPRLKLFPQDVRGLVPFSLWTPDQVGTNDDAKRHLMSLLPDGLTFQTPKPETLLERIIHIGSDPGDIVLDCFAGSGTTAATAHKMGRRWVAVERLPEVVADVTLPRLRKVIEGSDPGGITSRVGWEGGGSFSLFDARRADVKGSPDVVLESGEVTMRDGEPMQPIRDTSEETPVGRQLALSQVNP